MSRKYKMMSKALLLLPTSCLLYAPKSMFYYGATKVIKIHSRLINSTSLMSDKSKNSSTSSSSGGDKTLVDPEGFSLDLDRKDQEKLEDFKKIISKNNYYDKYKEKIVNAQKASPKSFLGIIEQLMRAGKKATGFEKTKLHLPTKNSLDEVMKLEMLLKVDREDIIFIWQEYHHSLNMIAATMNTNKYETICSRGNTFRTFILPLPKKDGYEMFMVQFGNGSFYITPLIKYQSYKENSPVCLSLIHYTELQSDKDLILMRGEFDKDCINLTEAQFLAVQLNLYYGEGNEKRLDILKIFNESPAEFDHMVVIEELKSMRICYPHLFPELS